MSRILALFALLVALAGPAAAAGPQTVAEAVEARFGSAETLADAVDALALAVLIDDRETVAALVKYPLETMVAGQELTVSGPEEFVRRYDSLITDEVALTIAEQDFAELTLDATGVAYVGGAPHLTEICLDHRCSRSYWVIDAIGEEPAPRP